MNSREKLTNAMFTVMKQYYFKEITVTQITQEAELSRRTFYRLYTTKEDILNDYLNTIFVNFSEELQKREIHHYWDVVQLYFDYWEQREDMILLFKKHELLPLLMETTRSYADQIFSVVRSTETADTYSSMLPYMLAYTVGGMHSMMVAWIIGGKRIASSLLIQNIKAGMQSPEI